MTHTWLNPRLLYWSQQPEKAQLHPQQPLDCSSRDLLWPQVPHLPQPVIQLPAGPLWLGIWSDWARDRLLGPKALPTPASDHPGCVPQRVVQNGGRCTGSIVKPQEPFPGGQHACCPGWFSFSGRFFLRSFFLIIFSWLKVFIAHMGVTN